LGFANPLVSKYVPSIDNGNGLHRFSDAQLREMAKSSLDQGLFLRYIEAKWPLSKLKTHCTQANLGPERMQNLVPIKLCFKEREIPIHKDGRHEFDKKYAYANEILDHPAISGRYLFPQQRYVDVQTAQHVKIARVATNALVVVGVVADAG
jgi:hypothetical protein